MRRALAIGLEAGTCPPQQQADKSVQYSVHGISIDHCSTGWGVSCLGTPTYRAHLHSYLSASPTLPSVMGSTQEVVFLLHACV